MSNDIDILEELGKNFLTYAIDVDQNKAFPSVRDGCLPGARAALWEMYSQKYTSNKPHVKSAKVASGVIGRWWPHNSDATYGTLVRMAQPFIENCLEVDFQGAAGNVIGGQQSYGSSRYTEMRLSELAEDGLFFGIDKNNTEMIPNYTQDELWPKYLPAVFPKLLVNGSVGLGVGVSQNFVLHNFQETADVIVKYITTGIVDNENYYPDFPTGGTIVNQKDLAEINKTGRGKVIVEAQYELFPKERKIVFTEFPYQVYIEDLIGKIKKAVNEEKIVSLDDVYNSSDKNSISVTVIVAPDYSLEFCVNELFSTTPLRSQYNVIQNGIVTQVPELVNLEKILEIYVEHNTTCIKKEHQYDLDKANTRIEILNGLIAALANIDDIVHIIRESENAKGAATALQSKYNFTDNQCKAILDMRLSKLTHLDGVGLRKELKEKQSIVEFCSTIVNNEDKQKEILIERLQKLAKKYGTPRRTKVIQKDIFKTNSKSTVAKNATVQSEPCIVSFNPIGYLQRIPIAQASKTQFDSFKTKTDEIILLFSNRGKMYRIGVKDIKECGPKDKGTAIGAIINLDNDEKIISIFSNSVNEKRPYLFFAMKNGMIKKSEKINYIGNTRNLNGIVVCKKDVEVISIQETNGNDVILYTNNDMYIRFHADDIRPSGKTAGGIKGINLVDNDYVIGCDVIDKEEKSEFISQNRGGKGKRVPV